MLNLNQIQIKFDLLTLQDYFLFTLHFFTLLAIIATFFLIIYAFLKYLLLIKSLKKPYVILEITPPHISEQSPYTTEQFFNLIHSLSKHKSLIAKFFNIYSKYSFEIVSTKTEGIRYLIRVPEQDGDIVQKALLSYLSDIKIKQVKDYLNLLDQKKTCKYTEFKLSNNTLLPLAKQDTLNKHDPIAYITGSMTKLEQHELIAIQFVTTALSKKEIPDYAKFSKLIYAQKDLVKGIRLTRSDSALESIKSICIIGLRIMLLPLGILVFIFSDGKEGPLLRVTRYNNDNKSNNPYQNELEEMIKGKLDQPLFRVSMRLLICSDVAERTYKIQRGFISSLSSYTNAGYQSILKSKGMSRRFLSDLKEKLFTYRAINPFKKIILSTSELSDLYHFPFTKTTKTEDIVKAHSKELPAPVSLKKADNLGLMDKRVGEMDASCCKINLIV